MEWTTNVDTAIFLYNSTSVFGTVLGLLQTNDSDTPAQYKAELYKTLEFDYFLINGGITLK